MSGFLQNMSDADAVVFRLEGFDMPDFTGLPALGMVNQQFCVHTEELVQECLILHIIGAAD